MDKYPRIYVIAFLIAGVIAFPYSFSPISSIYSTSTRLFTLATISSLATSLLLLNFSRLKISLKFNRLLISSIFLFYFVAIIHFFIFKNYSFTDFFLSIFWLTVPLFIFLFSDILIKFIPIYLCLLWITDLFVSYLNSGEKIGIAGNRNWHASFLIVTFFFSIYLIYTIIRHLKKLRTLYANILITFIGTATAILTIYTVYIFYLCNSRAAALSITAIGIIFICIKIISHLKLSKTNILFITLSSFILICLAMSILLFKIPFFSQTNNTTLPARELATLNEDVRLPLWKGTFKLIKDYPIIGVGTARFESVFAPYRPLDYFTKPNHATRSNHPHNTLLYIAACFGIPVLIIWSILWIYPMIYCFSIYSRLNSVIKISLLTYFALFFHGLLDLVLFQWPTFFIAAILLGLLWRETWKQKQQTEVNKPAEIIEKIILYPTALLILFLTFYNVGLNYKAFYFFKTGNYYADNNQNERAVFQYQRGLNFIKKPKFIYKAAMLSITSLKNPELALYFFNFFNKISLDDYAHKNAYIALALVKMGNSDLTLPFLTKEVVNYPLSVAAWYRLYLLQSHLNLKKEAEESLKSANRALAYKNLPQTQNALKLLVDNPEYDSHPETIPKEIIEKLNK